MQSIKVGELMVPVAEYATVSEEATLYDAVLALEEAQQKIKQEHQKYWSVLVLDKNQRVVGKLDQWTMLMAIEPRYKRVKELRETSRYGFSPEFYKSMLEDHGLWRNPLEDLCKKAADGKGEGHHDDSRGREIHCCRRLAGQSHPSRGDGQVPVAAGDAGRDDRRGFAAE